MWFMAAEQITGAYHSYSYVFRFTGASCVCHCSHLVIDGLIVWLAKFRNGKTLEFVFRMSLWLMQRIEINSQRKCSEKRCDSTRVIWQTITFQMWCWLHFPETSAATLVQAKEHLPSLILLSMCVCFLARLHSLMSGYDWSRLGSVTPTGQDVVSPDCDRVQHSTPKRRCYAHMWARSARVAQEPFQMVVETGSDFWWKYCSARVVHFGWRIWESVPHTRR